MQRFSLSLMFAESPIRYKIRDMKSIVTKKGNWIYIAAL